MKYNNKPVSKNKQSWMATLLILFISLPLISAFLGNAVNDAAHSNVSGEVYVDPLYQHVFKGTEAKEENALTGETYTANLGYTFASLTTESGTVNEAVVYKGTSTDTNVVIPTSYVTGGTTYTVIGVDYSGFANFATLASVTFNTPSNITLIDAQAFACCPALTKFNTANNYVCSIPLNLTELHSSAFYNDYSFQNISFSSDDGETTTTVFATIDDNAFNGCLGLKNSLSFPSSLRTIGNSAFANCKALPSAIMTTGMLSIGSYAFYNCSSLVIIGIPSTVTSIGDNAFRLCAKAKAYIGNAYRYSTGWPNAGSHATDSNDANTDYTSNQKSTGTCVVGDWNYASNSYAIPIFVNMDAITTDATVNYTYSRTWIPYDPTAATTSVNYNIGFFKITIVSYIGTDATSVSIPQTLKFSTNDSTKKTITVGGSQIGIVTEIGQYAFQGHTEITGTITLPNTCEIVDSYAFSGCTAATGLVLNDKKVSSLINTVLGSDTPSFVVPYLSSGAVAWAAGVANLDMGTNPNDYIKFAYSSSNTNGLTGLVTIQTYGFSETVAENIPFNSASIISLTIPATVQTIGSYAFASTMTSLKTLTFNGATNGTSDLLLIDADAFYNVGYYSLGTCDLILPSSLTGNTTQKYIVGNYAFGNCRFLHSVWFKDLATTDLNGNETGLATVTATSIANNIVSSNAFTDATQLCYIYCGNRVAQLASNAFLMNSASNLCWYYGGKQMTYGTSPFGANANNSKMIFYTAKLVNKSDSNIAFIYNQSYQLNTTGTDKIGSGALTISSSVINASLHSHSIKKDYTYLQTYSCISGMYGFTPGLSLATTTTAKGVLVSDYALGLQYFYNGSTTVITHNISYSTTYNGTTYPAKTSINGSSLNAANSSNGSLGSLSAATAVGRAAFLSASTLTSVVLPSSVTIIDECAFANCTSLINVGMSDVTTNTDYQVLPTYLTTIGDAAFNNTAITKIALGASVNSIGSFAFFHMDSCANLTVATANTTYCSDGSVAVGALYKKNGTTTELISLVGSANTTGYEVSTTNNTQLSTTATTGCYNLRSDCTIIDSYAGTTLKNTIIVLDTNLITINDFAFFSFDSITAPTLVKIELLSPNTSALTSYGKSAFEYQTAVTNMTLPNNSANTVTFKTEAFRCMYALTAVSFPPNVSNGVSTSTLASFLFDTDRSLKTIDLPSSVTTIDEVCFWGCSSLKRVNNTSNLKQINREAFAQCSVLAGFDSDTVLTIPSTLVGIEYKAFEKCYGLKTVDFSNATSLDHIGTSGNDKGAFTECTNISSLGQDSNGNEVGFSNCTSLKTISKSAFYKCSSLTALSFPASLVTIEDSAFNGCTKVASISFATNSNLTTIGSSAFTSLGSSVALYSIDLSNCTKLNSLGTYAFSSSMATNHNGNTVTLPNQTSATSSYLTEIPENCFNSCRLSYLINLGSNYTSIGKNAFANCGYLQSTTANGTSFVIPNSITSLGNYAFINCVRLTVLSFGTGITAIPDYCCKGCSGLTDTYFNGSVTSIGTEAFNGNVNLARTQATGTTVFGIDNVYRLPDSVTSIGAKAFYNCKALTTVYMGSNISSLGTLIFNGCYADSTKFKVYFNHTYSTSGYDGSWNMGAGGSSTTRVSVYWRSTGGGSTYSAIENTAVLTPGYAAGYFYFPTSTTIGTCTLAA
jgi:hypothetical protein